MRTIAPKKSASPCSRCKNINRAGDIGRLHAGAVDAWLQIKGILIGHIRTRRRAGDSCERANAVRSRKPISTEATALHRTPAHTGKKVAHIGQLHSGLSLQNFKWPDRPL